MPDLFRRDGVFSEVLRAWPGETVAIIAGGFSLSLEQIRVIHDAKVRTIAVNDAYLLAPWADLLYFSDALWQSDHFNGIARQGLGLDLTVAQVSRRFRDFPGALCSLEQQFRHIPDERLHILKQFNHGSFSKDPRRLAPGSNSTLAALNLAVLAGASKVVIVGLDCRPGPRTHWHNGHPRPVDARAYETYRRGFHDAQNGIREAGVRVINATPDSAVTAFEHLPIERALST